MDRITLESGRIVTLSRLEQTQTYAGLLCGFRDAAMTARRIEYLLEAGERMGFGKPLLVHPAVTRREVTGREGPRIEERLPEIACLARFDSVALPGSDDCCSGVVVAWFQDRFGEISEEVFAVLRSIDWVRQAAPWSW